MKKAIKIKVSCVTALCLAFACVAGMFFGMGASSRSFLPTQNSVVANQSGIQSDKDESLYDDSLSTSVDASSVGTTLNGNIVDQNKRTTKYLGDQYTLVVLVDFLGGYVRSGGSINRDTTNTVIKETDLTWSHKIFGTNKNSTADSVAKYYNDVTNGKLRFKPVEESYTDAAKGGVANDGVVKVRLNMPHPNVNFTNDPYQKKMSEEVAPAALTEVYNKKYVDFKKYDKNKDNILTSDEMHYIIIMAGYDASVNGTSEPYVHPHWFNINSNARPQYITLGGLAFRDYLCFSDKETPSRAYQIGTICHELIHDLRITDMYYKKNVVGNYSPAATGNKIGNPRGSSVVGLDAYSKYVLGLGNLVTVKPNESYSGVLDTYDVKENYNLIKVETNNSLDFFLIENRHKSGRDAALGISNTERHEGGIAVWRIKLGTGYGQEYVRLLEASGQNKNTEFATNVQALYSYKAGDNNYKYSLNKNTIPNNNVMDNDNSRVTQNGWWDMKVFSSPSKSAKVSIVPFGKNHTEPSDPIAPTGVSVTPTTASIAISGTTQLSATVTPANASQNVTWTSNNTAVATVNSNGLVTGVSAGTTTVTATTGNGKTATASITVNPPASPTKVTVSPKTDSIIISATKQLSAVVEPSNASQNVTWSSGNTAVATVSGSGLVTGVNEGTATITATTSTGNKTDTASITVTKKPNADAPNITGHPADMTVRTNIDANLAVTATGSGTLTYQWYVADSLAGVGTKIDSATNKTFNAKNENECEKYYYCVVTNTDNSAQNPIAIATSNRAKVIVSDAVPRYPAWDATKIYTKGDKVSYDGKNYEARQWTKGNVPDTNYGQGKSWDLLNDQPPKTDAEKPRIDTQPQHRTVTVGDIATLTIVASLSKGKGVLSYQWYKTTSLSDKNGTVITDATEVTFTIPTTDYGMFYYFCIVTNTDNSATGNKTATETSSNAMVLVLPNLGWSKDRIYMQGEVVSGNGLYYRCIKTGKGSEPSTEAKKTTPEFWEALAEDEIPSDKNDKIAEYVPGTKYRSFTIVRVGEKFYQATRFVSSDPSAGGRGWREVK